MTCLEQSSQTFWICMASSRVGARMRITGADLALSTDAGSARMCTRPGRRKPSVLPELCGCVQRTDDVHMTRTGRQAQHMRAGNQGVGEVWEMAKFTQHDGASQASERKCAAHVHTRICAKEAEHSQRNQRKQ